MTLEIQSSDHVLVDVLDRVLDKGIVIDATVRVSIVGVELLGVDARVVVASIETYLRHADTIAYTEMAAAPRPAPSPPLFAEPIDSVPTLRPGPSASPAGTDADPDSAAHPGSAAAVTEPPGEPDVPAGPGAAPEPVLSVEPAAAAESDAPVLSAEPTGPAERPAAADRPPSGAAETEASGEPGPGEERVAPGEAS